MRLLNVETERLEHFIGDFPSSSSDARGTPPYAILSHTWGNYEILFEDFQGSQVESQLAWQRKSLYPEVRGSCDQARRRGLRYIWIDTCCIDKSSSAELSEAINSMFEWYLRAEICFAYLEDLHCRWMSRGWTLQELQAPGDVLFYDNAWNCLGPRFSLAPIFALATGVDVRVLRRNHEADCPRVAQKFCWARRRETTREEDKAYCLLGIFDVNMPLFYGEKAKAVIRLQKEILRSPGDQSILVHDFRQEPRWGAVPFRSLADDVSTFKWAVQRQVTDQHMFYSNEMASTRT
ncbi:HET-domain-containing protein [Xylariomycetidae sp. FL0641]|nr:HET-domain-containing protein [Xylariomycetidae sp. FL0641]